MGNLALEVLACLMLDDAPKAMVGAVLVRLLQGERIRIAARASSSQASSAAKDRRIDHTHGQCPQCVPSHGNTQNRLSSWAAAGDAVEGEHGPWTTACLPCS